MTRLDWIQPTHSTGTNQSKLFLMQFSNCSYTYTVEPTFELAELEKVPGVCACAQLRALGKCASLQEFSWVFLSRLQGVCDDEFEISQHIACTMSLATWLGCRIHCAGR